LICRKAHTTSIGNLESGRDTPMGMYVWVVVGIMLAAVYVLPVAVGLFVSRLRTAVMLAVASFCGLFASVWSALGPLLAPLASVATQTELFTALSLSLLAGSLQAALLATMGHGLRRLLEQQCARRSVFRSEVAGAHRSSAAKLP
jgi:hypothetical protein